MAYKQHFIEWFSGKQLPSYWTTTNNNGTNTFAMSDSVDGGFSILNSGTNFSDAQINFGAKRQYAHNASVFIAVAKRAALGDSGSYDVGLSDDNYIASSPSSKDFGCITVDTGNYDLKSSDGSTNSATAGSIASDTSFHVHKIVFGSSNLVSSIDGVVDITKTTNRPSTNLQPHCETFDNATELRIRYMEVYNT